MKGRGGYKKRKSQKEIRRTKAVRRLRCARTRRMIAELSPRDCGINMNAAEQQWYSGLRNARTGASRLRPSMLSSRFPFSPFSRFLHVPNEDSFPSSPFPFTPSNYFAHACLPLVSHFCRFSYFLTFKRKFVLPGEKKKAAFVFSKVAFYRPKLCASYSIPLILPFFYSF